jgi:multicomponent Na+:H+ antiporter subunit E
MIGVGHLPVGLITAALATWASLHLLPPARQRIRLGALLMLALRFLGASVLAGWDVARRALDPRLPIRPGFVTYLVRFPPGQARNVFTALTSLLPGTVPAGEEDGALLYHCLDTQQPVVRQLAVGEAVLTRVLGGSP